MKLRKILAANLRREMSVRGLSQSELARQIGVAPARVNEILAGKYSPTLDTVERLAAGLGILPTVLLLPSAEPIASHD